MVGQMGGMGKERKQKKEKEGRGEERKKREERRKCANGKNRRKKTFDICVTFMAMRRNFSSGFQKCENNQLQNIFFLFPSLKYFLSLSFSQIFSFAFKNFTLYFSHTSYTGE